MAIESVLGLSMLVICFICYSIYYAFTNINWPLIWFCMRKDV